MDTPAANNIIYDSMALVNDISLEDVTDLMHIENDCQEFTGKYIHVPSCTHAHFNQIPH